MVKIYFNYDGKEREGFRTVRPFDFDPWDVGLENESCDEIAGENILERQRDLVGFIEVCYRILKVDSTATFTAPYYTSWQAWQNPHTIRGISQASLNFADKTWREQNGCPQLAECDFAVGCNFAIDLTATQRSEAAKEFWLNRYNNVVQSVMFTLTKRGEVDVK